MDRVRPTMAEVTAERRQQALPGRTFAQACAVDGLDACVEYDVTITDSLTSSRRKPRYPARNMLKIVDLSRNPRRSYWYESPAPQDAHAVNEAAVRPELTNRTRTAPVPELSTTTGWLQVPPGLWEEDPETFEALIDYRLVARLGTAENHTIIRGDTGLLAIPGIGRMTSAGGFGATILAACNEVEQVGSTVDGLILNPADYYALMRDGHLLNDLEQNGVFIVRARLVDPGTAIVGDFGHGAELFDAGRSVIRFAEPPPGTFAEPGIALMAQIHERVVVNLPATFRVVTR
ncbi:MAG: family 3 encapsulin nanocompartment shell protein [Frankiaceae bacterium]